MTVDYQVKCLSFLSRLPSLHSTDAHMISEYLLARLKKLFTPPHNFEYSLKFVPSILNFTRKYSSSQDSEERDKFILETLFPSLSNQERLVCVRNFQRRKYSENQTQIIVPYLVAIMQDPSLTPDERTESVEISTELDSIEDAIQKRGLEIFTTALKDPFFSVNDKWKFSKFFSQEIPIVAFQSLCPHILPLLQDPLLTLPNRLDISLFLILQGQDDSQKQIGFDSLFSVLKTPSLYETSESADYFSRCILGNCGKLPPKISYHPSFPVLRNNKIAVIAYSLMLFENKSTSLQKKEICTFFLSISPTTPHLDLNAYGLALVFSYIYGEESQNKEFFSRLSSEPSSLFEFGEDREIFDCSLLEYTRK